MTVDVRVPSPHTTTDVVDTLSTLDSIDGAGVALVHYGERSAPLTTAYALRGASTSKNSVCMNGTCRRTSSRCGR